MDDSWRGRGRSRRGCARNRGGRLCASFPKANPARGALKRTKMRIDSSQTVLEARASYFRGEGGGGGAAPRRRPEPLAAPKDARKIRLRVVRDKRSREGWKETKWRSERGSPAGVCKDALGVRHITHSHTVVSLRLLGELGAVDVVLARRHL